MKIPERFRTKRWAIIGIVAGSLALLFTVCTGYSYLTVPTDDAAAAAASVAPTPTPTPTPAPSGALMPRYDEYTLGLFVNELLDCYESANQPVRRIDLEEQVLAEADQAALTLMRGYHDEICDEPAEYREIPGRTEWLVLRLGHSLDLEIEEAPQ